MTFVLRAWPVLLPAVAVGLGAVGSVEVAGASALVSWVDLANLAVLVAGAVTLARTRRPGAWRPDDPAVLAYVALLVVVGVQVLVPFVGEAMDAEIATGASRFAGPAVLLLGLTWLRRGARDPVDWPWREALAALGVVLAVGIVVDAVGAIGDPAIEGFYDWKRTLQQPVGVSNIIAGYTAFTFWPALSLTLEDRRWAPVAGLVLLATGLTLSRGAALGLLVAAVVVVVGRTRPRLAVVGLLAVTLGLTVTPIALDTTEGADGLLSSALRVRDEQFTAAFEAWQDDPLLGVGLNRFQEDVPVRTSQPTAAAVDGVIPYDHPNNAWLVALAEVGLLGAAAYLALWVLLARRILALAASEDDGRRRAALAAAGAASGLAVHAQLEALTFTRGIEVLLALLLAATWATAATTPDPAQVRE